MLIFEGAYIQWGLSTEGNLRFKVDWASHIVGSKFTVFALFFHLALSATIIQEDQLSYIQTLSSDFVINSYGASWDSSCEQS